MRYMRKLHPYLDILVSNIGEVFVPATSNSKAHWTFGYKHSNGYRTVRIDGKDYLVHRLVAQTFLGQIPRGMEVDHRNRVKDDNRVENLRIVTSSENKRNTSSHDRVTAQGRTHFYEDERQYNRERAAHHYTENKGKIIEQQAHYKQAKCKTHKRVRFSDSSMHWVPLPEADAYLIIPLKERHYGK